MKIKTGLFFFCIFFFGSCYQKGNPFNSSKEDFLLFDASRKKTSKKLETLLEILNIKHDGSLEGIVKATHRPAGKERWEMEDNFKDKQVEINPILASLGVGWYGVFVPL